MLKLNRTAVDLLQKHDARARTEVTGFALIGHAFELAEKSGARLCSHADRIPFLPGAEEYTDMWRFPAGTANNEAGLRGRAQFTSAVTEEIPRLRFTPETSGGLLAAVPPDRLDDVQTALAGENEPLYVVAEVVAPHFAQAYKLGFGGS